MSPSGRTALALVAALLVGAVSAATASAQERTALTKSGVTRLLTGSTYSSPEVAGIIRRSCLTFEPTRRDLDDFREMGADDRIIRAITTCAEESERGAETPAGPDSLQLDRRDITAAAGDTVALVARVQRESSPQPGVRLMLEGTRQIRDGAGRELTAISDSAGEAVFRIPVGTEIGRYSLRVTGGTTELAGEDLVTLSVRAAAPFRARVTPDPLALEEGEEAGVVVRVRDRFGNPVRDARVSLRSQGPGEDAAGWEGVTDRTGETRIEVAATELGSREPLGVLVEGELLNVLPVRRLAAGPEATPGGETGDPGEDAGEEEIGEEPTDEEPGEDPVERRAGQDPGDAAPGQRRPPLVELALWGGHTFDNNRDPQPQTAEVAVWPTTSVRLWGRYDDALNIEHHSLVRGEIDYRALYAGGLVKWGEAGRLRSLGEFGRRIQPLRDVVQTLYRLEQEVLLGPSDDPEFERVSVKLEGILGHWHDRDDYMVGAGTGIPVSPEFRLEPFLHYGETVGTVIAGQRVPARETRLSLRGLFRSERGWELDARLTTADVDSEEEPLSGGLFDATLQVAAPLGGEVDLRIFSRYQTPPGMDEFVEVGLGLTTAIAR